METLFVPPVVSVVLPRSQAIEDAVGSALRDVWAKVQGAQEEVTRLNQAHGVAGALFFWDPLNCKYK